MSSFLSSFKQIFSGVVALVLTVVIAVAGVYINYDALASNLDVLLLLGSVLPWLLLAFAAIYAQMKNNSFVAAAVLLFGFFASAPYGLIKTIELEAPIELKVILGTIAFIYLALQALANLSEVKQSKVSSAVGVSALLAFTFFVLRDGATAALVTILPAVLALVGGALIPAIAALIAGVIAIPFNIIYALTNDLPTTVFTWIFAILGLYLLVTGVMAFAKQLKEE